ncbi:MAG: aminomethyl-transferring glycine dehydrogenase [Cellvibrionaceae bacterium]|nr:aminomethyl-transferring glycine dehydrogenase [Cellvibrionaceae bacterium]
MNAHLGKQNQVDWRLAERENHEDFVPRHIGPRPEDCDKMLSELGLDSLDALMAKVLPKAIVQRQPLALDAGCSERQALDCLRALADKNQVFRSYIGQGYYPCETPRVIQRNILENPAWYTAYTPYQPEISQGRLEAILNFQTLVANLSGMDLANASLLDEATAAAEAMTLSLRVTRSKSRRFLVDHNCLPQTIEVLKTRAAPLDIELVIGDAAQRVAEGDYFGVLLQYPGVNGEVEDYSQLIAAAQSHNAIVSVAADLLALVLLKSPGAIGADIAVGSSQRFGVPMGFGGPHAAFMATREKYKRSIPGRIVGISKDAQGRPAYRLALQTREQHIRREKATSNICTSQVLLAVIASMYAVYHGPEGLRGIAQRVHRHTTVLAAGLRQLGFAIENSQFFDTLTVVTNQQTAALHRAAQAQSINFRIIDDRRLGISLDETVRPADIEQLWSLFAAVMQGAASAAPTPSFDTLYEAATSPLKPGLLRSDAILSHPVFNRYHSETELLRYMRRLADKDIALDRAMIPLGSCTMKLNATAEMIPITWEKFAGIHPFVPSEQAAGYHQLFAELENMLATVTGYDAVSLQPNAGSQGEYAGLLAIRAYHASRGDAQRDICLIPSSAHGTNPASAQMCHMRVVVVNCDAQGNVDLQDLARKVDDCGDELAAVMITYPSTHGVFEENIREITELVHAGGGQVYIDGANLNAMVGLCQPGEFGGDVSHLNLHKTFCIPHGGGGPGVGPIAVGAHLAPFMPGHSLQASQSPVGPVAAAPWGSASILPISWMYIKMMGAAGLKRASQVAILNANYIAARLQQHYPVLYKGEQGFVAHECILDLRPLKERCGISVEDVAKRLIDFGFHAPTMSFPVAGTLMVEPTESESLAEIDRFCEAMIQIRREIAKVESGEYSAEDNPLVNAPFSAEDLLRDEWLHPYSRSDAAYPANYLRQHKYWPPVGRVDNVYGDRNLMCSCPSMEDY